MTTTATQAAFWTAYRANLTAWRRLAPTPTTADPNRAIVTVHDRDGRPYQRYDLTFAAEHVLIRDWNGKINAALHRDDLHYLPRYLRAKARRLDKLPRVRQPEPTRLRPRPAEKIPAAG